MSTSINSALQQPYVTSHSKESIFTRFITWCKAQEEQRLLWVGLALAMHGCFFAPLTIMIIGLTGFNFSLIMVALGAMATSLIVNLAALPTKITVPVFILSIVADLSIIAYALS